MKRQKTDMHLRFQFKLMTLSKTGVPLNSVEEDQVLFHPIADPKWYSQYSLILKEQCKSCLTWWTIYVSLLLRLMAGQSVCKVVNSTSKLIPYDFNV